MSAHTGRCFRAWRRLKARRVRQGAPAPVIPIRQKVPLILQPFMLTAGRRAVAAEMKLGLTRYVEHQAKIGHRPQGR